MTEQVAPPKRLKQPDPTTGAKRTKQIKLPLVGIVGAAGKTTTAWLLTAMLEGSDKEVGTWTSSGVYVDRTLRSDELHAWELAVFAARAREVDALVQEVPSVLANGLQAGAFHQIITTSICGPDDACRRDSTSSRDRDAVVRAVQSLQEDGSVIANADDLLIVEALESIPCNVFYYALHEANPILQAHLETGGDACWVENGWIVLRRGAKTERLMRIEAIPLALSGHLSYQLQNVLAATASALVLDVQLSVVRDVLRAFLPDPSRQPASSTMSHESGARVVIDTPRSIWGMRQLARSVRATCQRRMIIATDCLPQFPLDRLVEVGRLIGQYSGFTMMFSDSNDEDRVRALRDGIAMSDVPTVVVVSTDAPASMDQIAEKLRPGDTALILTGDNALSSSIRL